jgi:competence protein ComGC
MKTKNLYSCGFSLIEFLVYFLSITVLVMIVMSWMTRLHTSMVQQEKECTASIGLQAAYDRLVRDVRQAPSQQALWLKNETNEYVWRLHDHDVGWECTKQGALVRSEGSYSTSTGSWTQRTKSIVIEHGGRLEIALGEQQNSKTVSAQVILTGSEATLSRTLRLYNGTYL